ncbi:MAG: DUF4202 domain-containing protein [Rhizobiales bacterium]|nr:DUF4202 domain-containing protein [Hyphomicrobiales bacterium]
MMHTRLATVLAAIDAANGRDPVSVVVDGSQVPRALIYGQRMSMVLADYQPDASEELQISARAQHIERWVIPRESYPDGRIAYLKWRKDLQHHHAQRMAGIMGEAGYSPEAALRVGSLLHKERLKYDAEVQTLEDVICLVFLQFEAPEFIAKHDDGKVRDILAKTARKMSPRGIAEAAKLTLDARLQRLLSEALAS